MPDPERPNNPCGPSEMARWKVIESGPSIRPGSRYRIVEYTDDTGLKTRYWVAFYPDQWEGQSGFEFQRRLQGHDPDWLDVSEVPAGVMWHAFALLRDVLAVYPERPPRIPNGPFGPEDVSKAGDIDHFEINVRINMDTDAAEEQLERLAERAQQIGREGREPAEPQAEIESQVLEPHIWTVVDAPEPLPLSPPPAEDCNVCEIQHECLACPGLDSDGRCEGFLPL